MKRLRYEHRIEGVNARLRPPEDADDVLPERDENDPTSDDEDGSTPTS